jgi:hypothetical protein
LDDEESSTDQIVESDWTDPKERHILLIAIWVITVAQLSGMKAINFYSNELFKNAGATENAD